MSRQEIEDLVMRIQADYLEIDGLALTPSQAARRFDRDAASCIAVLETLADAGVVARVGHGAYNRHRPGPATTRHAA
jgi:hypothetical protein